MPGPDLRLAEEQRRVMPAAVEQIDERVGDAWHFGFVLAEAFGDALDIGDELRPVELEPVDRFGKIVRVRSQDHGKPMGELEVSVPGHLRLAKRLDEGIVPDPVQLAGYGFQTDIRHDAPRLSKSKFVSKPIGRAGSKPKLNPAPGQFSCSPALRALTGARL